MNTAFPSPYERGLTSTFFVTAGLLEKDSKVLERFAQLRAPTPMRSARWSGTTYAPCMPMVWKSARIRTVIRTSPGYRAMQHGRSCSARGALSNSASGRPSDQSHTPSAKPERHFTAETVSLAEEVGYQYACQVLFRGVRASDSRFRIPRFFVSRRQHQGAESENRRRLGSGWCLAGEGPTMAGPARIAGDSWSNSEGRPLVL
jgi:hypothetical protein